MNTLEVEIEDIATNTDTLDALITIANGREYFDLEEIERYVSELNDKGIKAYQLTGELIDWTRDRMYCSGDRLMNVLLDVRNIVAPYPVLTEVPVEINTNTNEAEDSE